MGTTYMILPAALRSSDKYRKQLASCKEHVVPNITYEIKDVCKWLRSCKEYVVRNITKRTCVGMCAHIL